MKADERIGIGRIGAVIPDEVKSKDMERYWDDLSGEELKSELVTQARQEEMREFKKHGVYKKVPISL